MLNDISDIEVSQDKSHYNNGARDEKLRWMEHYTKANYENINDHQKDGHPESVKDIFNEKTKERVYRSEYIELLRRLEKIENGNQN